jgi:hypothetical protein
MGCTIPLYLFALYGIGHGCVCDGYLGEHDVAKYKALTIFGGSGLHGLLLRVARWKSCENKQDEKDSLLFLYGRTEVGTESYRALAWIVLLMKSLVSVP